MGKKISAGFTIIELMLFLAISGLMMIGIFAAGNNAINNQRYSTAVSGLQDFMQGQYNSVVNVRNDRTTGSCSGAGLNIAGALSNPIGQSDCTVIGRFITLQTTGAGASKVIDAYPVYATTDITDPSVTNAPNDRSALQNSGLVTDTSASDTYALDWDTNLVQPHATPMSPAETFSLLVYRSPLNGHIATLWNATGANAATIVNGPLTIAPLKMCISPSGWTSIGTMGVMVDTSNSGSSDAISRIASGGGC